MHGMQIFHGEMATSIQVDGYQEIRIETDANGTVFVYMGDNFVAFTPNQFREFAVQVYNHK